MTSVDGNGTASDTAALLLDRVLRYQLPDAALRPAYARHFRDQLARLSEAAEGPLNVEGRFVWIKRILRRLLRPFLHRQAEFNRLAAGQFAELHEALASLLKLREEIADALSADLHRRLGELRTELYIEVRSLTGEATERTAAQARSYAALRAMGDAPRLNLGCNGGRREGLLNLDDIPSPHADLVTPLDRLPVQDGTVEELVLTRILERYPAAEVERQLLPRWVAALRPGGKLVVITSDLETAAERLREGEIDYPAFVACLFGTQLRPAERFRSAYTLAMLRELLERAGLERPTLRERRQAGDAPVFELELEAYRPAASCRSAA
jgi:hypothetical protein